MDAPWENRGPDNCDDCAVACYTGELIQQVDGDLLCAACSEARALEMAEKAEEDADADYYGGDSVGSYGPDDPGRGAP